jgi:tetratricopeptide (TPR) repeat protein
MALGAWTWLLRVRADRAELAARSLQEHTEQRNRTSRAVNEALDEALHRHRLSGGSDLVQLVSARTAAQHARALLPDDDDELRPRVERVLAGIEHDERQARARLAQAARDRRMARDIEQVIRHVPAGKQNFDLDHADKSFRAAFGRYDLAIETLGPTVAADRINHSSIRRDLLNALDAWMLVRRLKGAGWQRLHEVLRRADPDPWRNRFRDALVVGDFKKLPPLGGEAELAAQPAATLELLASLFRIAGENDRAIVVLRVAALRHPSDYGINFQLGAWCLQAKPPQFDAAVRYFTVAMALRPDARSYAHLGLALGHKGESEEAITWLRKALSSQPDYLEAQQVLGALHLARGDNDEAAVVLRQVAQREPSPTAWYQLGVAHVRVRALSEAEAAFRKGIQCDPKEAALHLALANVLQLQGRLTEALSSAERSLKLASGQAELKREARRRRNSVQRWIDLESQLPALRQGKPPANSSDRLDLAGLCAVRGLPLTAVRLYQEALAASKDPTQRSGLQYISACNALRAGLSQGAEAATLSQEERARWRRRALAWLREYRESWERFPKKNRDDWRTTERAMSLLRSDRILALVQKPEALARLPAEERRAWQRFWNHVDQLLKRSQQQR